MENSIFLHFITVLFTILRLFCEKYTVVLSTFLNDFEILSY